MCQTDAGILERRFARLGPDASLNSTSTHFGLNQNGKEGGGGGSSPGGAGAKVSKAAGWKGGGAGKGEAPPPGAKPFKATGGKGGRKGKGEARDLSKSGEAREAGGWGSVWGNGACDSQVGMRFCP